MFLGNYWQDAQFAYVVFGFNSQAVNNSENE